MRENNMVTLRQVAAATGVHSTTASVVLNSAEGNTRVGEATRKRIAEAAKRLGYIRNESASRLRTGKSNAVGFIGGDLRNPFFAELTAALERELHLHHLQLVLSHVSSPWSSTFSQMVEIFQRQRVSKIIYWDESASRTGSDSPTNSQLLPIGFTIQPRPGVWLDLDHAVRQGVSYLLEQNRRRVCFFAPAGKRESPSVAKRQKVFLDECRRRKLQSATSASYEGESWDIEAAVKGARELLKRETSFDAFFGFNDVASLGLLLATANARPKPMVICFDGSAYTRCWRSRPPVFDLKIAKLAQMAVAVCVGKQDPNTAGRKEHWLRPELIPAQPSNSKV